MASSESEGQGPARKRSRTSTSTGDGASPAKEGRKARGRPRVDTQDATAADRRRTQIRLAQRAYRQRKETTISSLKQEGSQLQTIIEQMNATFLQFNESAIKSGLLQLNPGLAKELKQAAETFTSLAKTATDFEGQDEEHGESAEINVELVPAKPQSPPVASPAREGSNIGWGYSAMPEQPNNPTTEHFQPQYQTGSYFQDTLGEYVRQSTSLVPKRQFTIGGILNQPGSSSLPYQSTTTTSQHSEPLPFGLVDILPHVPFSAPNPHIFSVTIPTPELTPPMPRLPTPPLQLPSLTNKTPTPIFTYSHQETTFARRLTRASLETAYHLLSTAQYVRPSALNYIFRLSLPFFTLDQLCEKFKLLLSRSIHEDLDFWETPFTHIGGAGTHYPRKDDHGNTVPRNSNWTVRQKGPREKRMVRTESADDGMFQDHSLDLSSFEGEWFDGYDVAGYLEEHWGCTPDPKSSFAECMVEDDGSGSGSPDDVGSQRESDESLDTPNLTHTTSHSSSVSTARHDSTTSQDNQYHLPNVSFGLDMGVNHNPPSHNNDYSKLNNIDLSFDQALGLDLAPGFDYGFPVDNHFPVEMNMGLDMMSTSVVEPIPVEKPKRKKVAWLDVNKLIDELIQHGVCLGRAPGFRRKDVDMAVHASLVAAY